MKIKTALAAGALAGVWVPATVEACSVCFSGARDSASLSAYYTVTILMTGVVILMLGGFYFFVFRRYFPPAGDARANGSGVGFVLERLEDEQREPARH